MPKLKAAIIGYGYMGEIRRRVLEGMSEQIHLSMICEPSSSKLTGPQPFEVVRDPKAVINSDVDLVFVCTPNNLIPELTSECLKRGKNVFCEKPPGRTIADVEEMMRWEKESQGAKLVFGFNHRFHPGVQRARSLIRSGKFGNILWLRGIYGKSGGKNFPQSWRNDKEVSGGGILIDQGIHMLDLFCYFCGDFEKVKAFTGNSYWNLKVEDNAFVILENQKGQHATLHSSATFWKHRFALEIGLEKGYLTIQGLLSKTGSYGRETLIIGRQQFEDETDAIGNPSEEMIYFDRDNSWEMEVQNFVQCVTENKPVMECSSHEALRVMKIIDQAYKQNGRDT